MSVNTNILYPTFKDAQLLYASYSTLETDKSLYNSLIDIIDSTFLKTLSPQSVREIYNSIILKYYPNEICIKSNFINKNLLKGKNHVTIFELPIGKSRADLCKVNGISTAYEIKTDLDNLSRLNKQINDYLQIFENVYIICSRKKLSVIEKKILPPCGIYTYTINRQGGISFNLNRHASISQTLNAENQLALLKKDEINKFFLTNNQQYKNDIINYVYTRYTPKYINSQFKKIMKIRYQNQWDFFKCYHKDILEIDYQWFYKNTINPQTIYH